MGEKDESIFDKAVIFAVHADAGMKRKDGGPYVTHVLETAVIISGMNHDENVIEIDTLSVAKSTRDDQQ